MNEEDFASDSDSDDSDFRPDKAISSGSESIDEADEKILDKDNDDDENDSKKKRKRRKKKSQFTKREEPIKQELKPVVDPEEEKRKEDALWAEFLGESEPPAPSTSTVTSSVTKKNIPKEAKSSSVPKPPPQEETKIFEFAGEEIIVVQNQNQQNILQTTSQNPSNTVSTASPLVTAGVKRPSSGGGLSSVLNQISKKNKLSILQKTKLDWDGFKSNEGIAEELQTHNRGRDG